VVVYTLLLKRTTPLNIVIGGAAGAVPPVVGWAAVTGEIGAPALALFGIIVFWTPPHFWALSLNYSSDYARAGVPMLPVVVGPEETKRQILLHSLALVAVSLLLPATGATGLIYLGAALALGGLFIWYAFRLQHDTSAGASAALFRYSILYLALLFVAVAADGRVYFSDMDDVRVRYVDFDGTLQTVAGTGVKGYGGDGGPATEALFKTPRDLVFDGQGNLYIADPADFRVRKVSPEGTISTWVGTGVSGKSGNNGLASNARVTSVDGLGIDQNDNLYLADALNYWIRRVTPEGIISVAVGINTGVYDGGDSPDGTVPSQARLYLPGDAAVDSVGNLFICDRGNYKIKVGRP
jgi:hypothetical protein